MNTKLLKQKILDLAIRGKLTQQLKSDGTAADLLKEICDRTQEKTSLRAKRGNPSPQTIIPLDKNEAPFEIPANWEWVRLGDVASDFQYGSAEKSQPEGKIAVLRMGNINRQGQVDYSDLVYTSNDAEIAKYLLNKNDVLFNRTNSPEWVGKTAIYKGEIPAIYAGYIIRIKPHFNSDYLNYLMCSDYERNWSKEVKTDGVHQSNINAQKLMAFAVPLPPLAEQQRIVEKIQEAFAEIDSIENNKELLKTHIKQARQKILDLAIHGKLVPKNKIDEPASVLLERITRDNPHYEKLRLDERRETKDERNFKDKCHSRENGNLLTISKDEIPFDIPENWVWCRLGNLSESIQYGYNAPAKDSGRIKMVRISDIHENEVEWNSVPYCDIDEKEIQTYLLKKNDILFARTGGTVGKSFIVDNLPEDAVYAGYLIRTRYGKNANAQYMKYFMESNLYWGQLRDGCIATAQPNCNGKTLGKMKIPLPPLNEQSRIVAKIEELFTELDLILQNT